METFTLVDTDILIDVGRNIQKAVNFLQKLEENSPVAISVVTEMELVVGCENKEELKELNGFIDRYEVVDITPSVSHKAVELVREYRLSHGLLIADAFIAATAIIHENQLASKNQKDYRYISGLDLLPYQ